MLEKYAKLLRQVAEERANEGNRDKNDRILILDGLNNYIRCFAAVPVLTDDGIHIGGITGFLLSMGSMIRQFKPTRCVVVFDGKNGSTRRKKLYSEYKEGRTFKLNPKRIENLGHSEEKELESMREQFKAIMTYLQNMPLTVMSIDNVEADDVIAYIAQNVAEKEVVISSMDKDFIHIVNDRISVWSPSAKQLITPG
jgi:DNA polymerase-1